MLAGFGGAAVVAAFVLSPNGIDDGPIICPFRRLTGLPCPGCGLTRSWVHLAHGDVGQSLREHAFGWLAMAFAVTLVVAVVVARLRGTEPPHVDRIVKHRRVLPWVLALAVVWLGYAVGRVLV